MSRPRPWLRGVAIAAAAVVATLLLVALRFPWDRLAPAAESALSEAAGHPVRIEGLGFGIGIAGPALEVRGVAIAWPDGRSVAFETIALRPAFSLDWLSGAPVLRIVAQGPMASFDGVAGPRRVEGRIVSREVAALPWRGEPIVSGALEATLDLAIDAGTVRGTATVSGRDGAIFPPNLPVVIPFDRVRADFALEGDAIRVAPLRLEGPMVSATATGTVVPGPGDPSRAQLDVAIEIRELDPVLGALVTSGGQALAPGRRLTLSGTLANPRIR